MFGRKRNKNGVVATDLNEVLELRLNVIILNIPCIARIVCII